MNLRMLVATSTSLLTLLSSSAFADDALTTSSEQAVIIFSKSCMIFAGRKDQLRTWAGGQKMQPSPPDMAAKLMGKHPGEAFGVTTPSGIFVIGSQDDGGCTLYVQHADGKQVEAKFEEIVALSKLNLKVTTDLDDVQNTAMHHKGYEISGQHRMWRVVISSTPQGKFGMDAIMTAYSMNLDNSLPGTGK